MSEWVREWVQGGGDYWVRVSWKIFRNLKIYLTELINSGQNNLKKLQMNLPIFLLCAFLSSDFCYILYKRHHCKAYTQNILWALTAIWLCSCCTEGGAASMLTTIFHLPISCPYNQIPTLYTLYTWFLFYSALSYRNCVITLVGGWWG